MVTTRDHGEISFQDYFVRHKHDLAVTSVRFAGAETCEAAPGVLEALESAERIVIAPSNPAVSIDPVLAVPGVREVLTQRRNETVAVSPIIGGKALKGPADRLLRELGREASAVGVARWYAGVIGTLIIDQIDADLAPAIEAEGVTAVVAPTIMKDRASAAALAQRCLD
jgi:LPPG:FO 2-phospho-L-lactate transferase